ncbi:hypothetical protein [Hellea balneolensis]|uniref:hypothetical protein n=1 Tax=Hellea balneolensis TaxID=287478 RepID=UPI0012B7144F|nr:hypothetical protein [Hellea balneolensis]
MTAVLLSIASPAFADNIAGCEVVLMEKIEQEGVEGTAEVASFRPAADFIASIYDDETEVLREIDGLPIRAVMCERKSVVPSLRDFPIIATGTPFMISQNFDSTQTGLTTIYFKDGEFRTDYKGPDLAGETEAKMKDRLEVFNLQPNDLAEKEKAMLAKSAEETSQDLLVEKPSEEKTSEVETLTEDIIKEESTEEDMSSNDMASESEDKTEASTEAETPEEPEDVK